MTSRSPEQSAQYIASALVGWHDAVRDHEGHRSEMVRDDTNGYIGRFCAVMISNAGFFDNAVQDIFNGIDIEDGIGALHDAGHSLQAHAGIDVRMCQIGIGAVFLFAELGKYMVPDL